MGLSTYSPQGKKKPIYFFLLFVVLLYRRMLIQHRLNTANSSTLYLLSFLGSGVGVVGTARGCCIPASSLRVAYFALPLVVFGRS